MKRFMQWGPVLFLLFSLLPLKAQLFPGLEGEDLLNAIRANYTPTHLLTEADVKDTLYASVFFKDDSVRCIYSGFAHDLPSGVDPSQWIYENGISVSSMNLEHAWPQAKGAGDNKPGMRNMHHLYPARTAINGDRGDLPFGDIEDAATQKWYYLNIETAIPPSVNRDAYSEYRNTNFEPRESVKGDIARAMFYFWTIYHDDAVEADPLFFDLMHDDLCLWEEADPVDNEEYARTQKIATYQDGLVNPFILDCTLVRRSYCPNLEVCQPVAVQPYPAGSSSQIVFDPTGPRVSIESDRFGIWKTIIFDLLGQKIFEGNLASYQQLELRDLPLGIFFIEARQGNERIVHRFLFLLP